MWSGAVGSGHGPPCDPGVDAVTALDRFVDAIEHSDPRTRASVTLLFAAAAIAHKEGVSATPTVLFLVILSESIRTGGLEASTVGRLGYVMGRAAPGLVPPLRRFLEVVERARGGNDAGLRTLQEVVLAAELWAADMLAEQQVAEVAAATDDLLDEPITIDGDPVRVVSLPAGAKRIELGHRLEMARYLVSLDAQRALEPAIEKMSARYADLVGAHRAFAPTMQNAAARFAELAGTDRLVESIADSMSARFGDIAGVNRMVEQMGETMSLRHGLGQYAHLGRPAFAGLTEPIGLAATKQVRETLAARLGTGLHTELARPAFVDVAARMPAGLDSSRWASMAGVRAADMVGASRFVELQRTRRALGPVMGVYGDSVRDPLGSFALGGEALRMVQRYNNDIARHARMFDRMNAARHGRLPLDDHGDEVEDADDE